MPLEQQVVEKRASGYARLKRSGDSIPQTNKVKAYVWRVSMLYALADLSKVVRPEHYLAALAVVEYCRASARLLFTGQQNQPAEPDPLWLQLLNAITSAPGISRSGLREVAGHKVPAKEIDATLASLKAQGLAYSMMVQPAGGGRPAECWYRVTGPDGDRNDNLSPDSTVPVSFSSPEMGREGTNSPLSASELVPSPVPLGSKLPSGSAELVPSLPAFATEKQMPDSKRGVSSLPAGSGSKLPAEGEPDANRLNLPKPQGSEERGEREVVIQKLPPKAKAGEWDRQFLASLTELEQAGPADDRPLGERMAADLASLKSSP